MRRRALTAVVVGAVALAAAAGLWRLGPAVTFAVALAAPAAEPWLPGGGGEPARHAVTVAGPAGPLDADLYRPPVPRGALLLVHGLSRPGRHHPELQRLARLLARQGQLVLVPHFASLAEFRLTGREVAEVSAALEHLARLHARLAVAGLSVGAGPALLAAAEMPRVRVVAAVGGYADLRDVVAFVTTGVARFGERRHVAHQEEYNRWKLLALLADLADTPADRGRLAALAARKLADPNAPLGPEAEGLGPGGRAILALVLNRDEGAVEALLAALPPAVTRALDALSPLPAAPRLGDRLILVHGLADPSIPYTESLRLGAAAGPGARVVLLRTFHHTGPRSGWELLGPGLLDGWRLVGAAADFLSR